MKTIIEIVCFDNFSGFYSFPFDTLLFSCLYSNFRNMEFYNFFYYRTEYV